MSSQDDILGTDPATLTVSRLKALLSEEGVELPTTKEPKSTYVDLFNAHKAKLLEKKPTQTTTATTTPPRKRKLRHSINVFQSGTKKQLTDDESGDHQKKIKKRKSLGINDDSSNQIDPPPPISTSAHHPIPSRSLSPPRYVLPPLPTYSQPHPYQPTSSQPQAHDPVPSRIPSSSLHSFQSPHQPQSSQPSHLRKYQLPPTLFQPQQKPGQASGVKYQGATYISPLYFSGGTPAPPNPFTASTTTTSPADSTSDSTSDSDSTTSTTSTTTSSLSRSSLSRPTPTGPGSHKSTTASQPIYTATTNTANKHMKGVPVSPSQLPLPPPPSPAPIPTQPRSPLPPPPSPLSAHQIAHLSSSSSTSTSTHKSTHASSVFPYIYVLLVVGLWIVALACLYSSVSMFFGSSLQFCDSDSASPAKDCVPCPPNGECQDGKLLCNPRYVRDGVQCIEDRELNLLAESIADQINEIVMSQGGKYQCGSTHISHVTVDQLKTWISSAYPSDKFDEAFVEALRKITHSSRFGHLKAEDDRFSSSKVTLSLPCMAKLALYEQLLLLMLLTLGGILAFGIRYWRSSAVRRTKEVNMIAAMVLDELQSKKSRGSSDGGIVVDHLRDKLLHGSSERAKQSIWTRVQAVVQADSRVVEYASFKHGAQVTNWEWADK
eukprot:Phypoly_transcript_00745.p1 GENE.Phypoly_transcript_00745~~Phypoly_transcript_00745.p1  ORF type:complete len:660 (+),score=105.84 Phypoly_transcript_00745:1885-3864(+)